MWRRSSGSPTPLTPQLDRAASVKVDMAEVRELDTLGAWLLEKMSRRATSAGHRADVVGVADNYAGLIEEVRQVNRRNPAPVPAANPVVAKVERHRPLRDRRDGRRDRVPADAGLAVPGARSACCAGRDRCG